MDIGLFGGNQQKLRIRLRAAGPEIGFKLLQAQIGQIARMPVTMKIHDDGGVDAHLFKHGLERRCPVEAFLDRLFGVRKVPVRGHDLKSR